MSSADYERMCLVHPKVMNFCAANPVHPAVLALDAAQEEYDKAWAAFTDEMAPILEAGGGRDKFDAVYDDKHRGVIEPLQETLNAAFWGVLAAAEGPAEKGQS